MVLANYYPRLFLVERVVAEQLQVVLDDASILDLLHSGFHSSHRTMVVTLTDDP